MNSNPLKETLAQRFQRYRMVLADFRDEIRGVAAVEFALIAPLMLLLYVGTVEVSGALATNRKLSRVSSAIGDLVTQAECFTPSTLAAITEIGDDIMYPYKNSLKLRITGIMIENGQAKVRWSKGYNLADLGVGSIYTVPNKIKTDGNFLIAAYVKTTYTPAVGWIATHHIGDISVDKTAIEMEEEMFLRPRIGNEITLQGSC